MKTPRRSSLSYAISVLFLLVVTVGYDSVQPHLKYIGLWFNVLLFGIWLAFCYRTKRPFNLPKAIVPILVYLALQSVLIPFAPFQYVSTEKVLLNLVIIISFIFVCDTLNGNWLTGTWESALLNTALVFTLIELGLVGVWYMRWYGISGTFSLPPVGYRISGLFLGHANVTAGFINLVFPIALVRLIKSNTRPRRIAWAIVLLLFLFLEYFTSSRGGWLGALMGIMTTLGLIYLPTIRVGVNKFKTNIINRFTLRNLATGLIVLILGIMLVYVFVIQTQITSHAPIASARSGIWGPAWEIFTSSPLWGHGPGSFSVLFALKTEIPPGLATSHAHNILLQIGTETGILGIAVILWAVINILRAFLRTWRVSSQSERIRLAAYAGAGAALAVHNLVDYLFESPLYIMAVLIVVSLALQQSPDSEKLIIRRRRASLFIGILFGIYILGTLYTLRGSGAYWEGVNAGREGRWKDAREGICKAMKDNPSVPLHFFQCGLANAYIGYIEDDPQSLADAIAIQKEGLKRDPSWPVHWANLAALEWEVGDYDLALSHMRYAVEVAPRNTVFTLNLGWMEEEHGSSEEARNAFLHAVEMDPWLRYSQILATSELIDSLLHAEPDDSVLSKSNLLVWEGWQNMQADRFELAEPAFTRAIQLNPQNAKAYAGLALLYQRKGQSQAAEFNVQTALFIGGTTPELLNIAGRVALQQGRKEDALWYTELAYRQLMNQSFSWSYYNRTYQRFFVEPDLVPLLRLVEIDLDMAYDINLLAEYFVSSGREKEAQQLIEGKPINAHE